MSITSSEMTPADIAAVTNNNGNGDSWGGNWSSWIILFLIFAIFGGRGFGFGGFGGGTGTNGGTFEGYTLASDFATIQRQMSDGFNNQERRTDAIINGICDLGYTQQSLANTTNMNVMQGNYNTLNAIQQNGYESRLATQTLGSQLANCCCDIKEGIGGINYNMAMNANTISQAISNGFCQTNFNIQNSTRDIIESQNAGTKAILDAFNAQRLEAKDEKIAEQAVQIQALNLAASQARQNEFLIDRLGTKCPVSAYVVQPPQQVTFPTNCCGNVNYANGGGCGNF